MRAVVRPVRFTAELPAMREFLVALGLAPRVEARRGGWLDLAAGAGMVALHDAATSDTGGTPGETRLSFEVDDFDELASAVRAAGFGAPSVYDEAYGRVTSLVDPLGTELRLDERDDDYGYLRHPLAGPPRMHVVPVLPAADPAFLAVLGLVPRAGTPAVLGGFRRCPRRRRGDPGTPGVRNR